MILKGESRITTNAALRSRSPLEEDDNERGGLRGPR